MQKSRDWRKNCVGGSSLSLHLQDLGSGFSTTVCSDGRLLVRTAVVLRASFVKSHFFPFPTAAEDGKETGQGKSQAVTCTLSLQDCVVTLTVPAGFHVSS